MRDLNQRRYQYDKAACKHVSGTEKSACNQHKLSVLDIPQKASRRMIACLGMYRDVHKKLTHLFYNFHGTKGCKDEFADTER